MAKIVALGEVVSDIYRGRRSRLSSWDSSPAGGAPANVAVAACRLGSEAAFVGSVGEDLFGDFILRALDSEGVDTSGVGRQQPPTRTSLAFVEIDADGDREFTFYRSSPAADELLSPEDVAEDLISGASFVNFGSIPLIREPVRSATHRAELARKHDVPVAFDVNFREHLWESAEAAREAVDPLLDLSTIVKLGDDELSPLLGTDDIEEAAGMLLDRRVTLVLVSKGPEGAFYATSEFSGEVPPSTSARSWTPPARRRFPRRGPRPPLGQTTGRSPGARSDPEGLRRRRPRLHRLRRHARPANQGRTRTIHEGQHLNPPQSPRRGGFQTRPNNVREPP